MGAVPLIAVTACSGSPTTTPSTTGSPTTIGGPTIGSSAEAIEIVRALDADEVDQLTTGVMTGAWPAPSSETAGRFSAGSVSLDLEQLASCRAASFAETQSVVDEVFELTHEEHRAAALTDDLWVVAYRVIDVVPEVSDVTTERAWYVTTDGIVGERGREPADRTSCWTEASTYTETGRRLMELARNRDSPPLGAGPDDDAGGSSGDADEAAGGGDSWPRRPGFPADPNDPEPLQSTGADTRDLITTDDPTAFACLVSHGRGPEEILDPTKSNYESVPDAHLFTAWFTDGTSIAIRVHPEVGDAAAATAEVERYTDALGRLPTTLRAKIGRFAIRLGDETATASPGEGISVQTGNMSRRISDDRLEETLFHESVHTGLDELYAYQRSDDWLAAQAADGRFLTEYGRENPDNEDLAESALYGYVLLHHPERFPVDVADAYRERIANRLAFIATLFPTDAPIFSETGQAPACTG